MTTKLLQAAALEIPDPHILVNMVSRRVRQLCLGARALVTVPPGMREADTALTEIIQKKLTFEMIDPAVVAFPTAVVAKKAA